REAVGELPVQLVPAGPVVEQHHARKRSVAHRPREVGVDLVAVVSGYRDGLGVDPLMLVGTAHRIHPSVCRPPYRVANSFLVAAAATKRKLFAALAGRALAALAGRALAAPTGRGARRDASRHRTLERRTRSAR